MIRSEHNELAEVFLHAYRDAGFDDAIDAVANASVMYANGKIRSSRKPMARDLDPIVSQVADAMGTTVRLLRCVRRYQPLADARHIACWLMRQTGLPWSKLSYPIIALALGMANHTSALHGARRVEGDETLIARARSAAARVRVERIAA
jgi:chromosomal replication initiation ATPase DnaA